MISFLKIFLFLFFYVCNFAYADGYKTTHPTLKVHGDELANTRLISFKKKIEFDTAISSEKKMQKVVIDWEKVSLPQELKDWNLKTEHYVSADKSHNTYYTFTKNSEQVKVSVKIFDPKKNSASDYLLIKADSVSTMDISDIRAPSDLGTLSLMSATTPHTPVYWVYRNLFSEVNTYKTSVSALQIARWVQGIAVASVVNS